MGDVDAVTSASSKLAAGLITEKEYRHILKVARNAPSASSAEQSPKMSREKNPFSFNNFDDAASATASPSGVTTTKASKRKGKEERRTQSQAHDDVDIFAEPTKVEPNPFSFKAYDATTPRTAVPAQPVTAAATTTAPRRAARGEGRPVVATGDDNDSDMSSSDSDASETAGSPRPPVAQATVSGDEDSWDSEDNDDGGTLPRPKAVADSPIGVEGGGGDGSIIARIKRRITLLKQQLAAANEELRMEREQHAMDMEDLRDENKALRKEVKQLRSAASKLEKKASSAESMLKRRTKEEQKEAAVLEDFTQRVEKNLEQTTKRAVAAEAKVATLTEELKRYKGADLPQGAMNQIKSASLQLKALSKSSKKSLDDLMAGAKTLIYVSEILQCAEKLAEVESDSD